MKTIQLLHTLSAVVASTIFTACYKTRQFMGKQEDIASTAESYIGSTEWATNVRKDNFPAGKPKCNKFVYDVLNEASVTAPLNPGGSWPLTAAGWADANHSIPNWKHMGYGASWQQGDVIAEKRSYANATGHCGIAVNSAEVVAAGTNSVTKGGHGFKSDAAVRRYEES